MASVHRNWLVSMRSVKIPVKKADLVVSMPSVECLTPCLSEQCYASAYQVIVVMQQCSVIFVRNQKKIFSSSSKKINLSKKIHTLLTNPNLIKIRTKITTHENLI